MTTGCGRCRRHPGSKKRPWNVEPASAEALRPGPPARVAKASLRKMRPAAVRLEVAGCIAWAGWPDLPWPGAIRADAAGGCAAGGCADCCRLGLSSRTFAQRGLGKTWPASTSHPFLWRRSDDRPLLWPMSCRPMSCGGGRCGRAGRTRELLRRDAVCRWRRPRRGGDPGRCCARCLRRHTRRGDVRGGGASGRCRVRRRSRPRCSRRVRRWCRMCGGRRAGRLCCR